MSFLFDFCCVAVADNPHKQKLGNETMTNNVRRESGGEPS